MANRPRIDAHLLAPRLHLLRPLPLLVTAVGGLTLAAALVLLQGHAVQSAGSCGNGVKDPGEQCDDCSTANPCPHSNGTCIVTNPGGPPGATNCVLATCGDGFQCTDPTCATGPGSGPEQCDDGNTANGDGCNARCALEPPTGAQPLGTALQYRGMGEVHSVALSPDGAHVYAVGNFGMTVFARNAGTGQLTFVDAPQQFQGGELNSVTVSPDGAHVYVAVGGLYSNSFANAVVAWARDAVTGTLTFVGAQQNGVNGVSGLAGAASVAVSPDGAHLYVASSDTNAVAVFSRNPSSGQLTFVEVQQQGVGGVTGLNGAHSVIVSPDGAHVYVAGFSSNAVAVFSRNASSGQLTFVEMQQQGVGGVTGLNGAHSVIVSPDGAHVYVASFSSNAVAVFSRSATTGQLTFLEVQQQGVAGVDGLSGASSVNVTPDGAYVYVASGAIRSFLQGPQFPGATPTGAVAVFARNTATGQLTFIQAQNQGMAGVDGLIGATVVAVSPDGAQVYVGATGDLAWLSLFDSASVVAFGRSGTGALTWIEAQREQLSLGAFTGVTISPDGAHVYAHSPGDSLAVLRRDSASGGLTLLQFQRDGVGGVTGLLDADNPGSVTVSPDGAHVYVAGSNDHAVAVFARNTATGLLTFVEADQQAFAHFPMAVTVSPDGAHVYVVNEVTAPASNAIEVYGRNAVSGQLTFVEEQSIVSNLWSPRSVTVSPDGAHVYVSGGWSFVGSVVVFARNSATGQLTFVEEQKQGVGGVDGLASPDSVTVSPDGGHVYTASHGDNAVAVFRRNAATGQLTFVEAQKQSINGVDGLTNSSSYSSLTLSKDGTRLYVASSDENAVAVFLANPATGHLTFVEASRGGSDSLQNPSAGAHSVILSPDGTQVYVAVGHVCGSGQGIACVQSDDFATFRVIRCGDGFTDHSEQCDDGNLVDGDGCDSNCTPTSCGNGIVTAGEQCDDGNTDNADTCIITNRGGTAGPANCVNARCGDGFACSTAGCQTGPNHGPEQCDDQNTNGGDGCSNTCAVEHGWYCAGTPSACTPKCGDGIIAGTEQCDDGNTKSGDGCSNACVVENGWYCAGTPSACTTKCGDGIVAGTEQCDDHNATAGDGCSNACVVENGWYCTGTPSACTTKCGDGVVAGTEKCDDGNSNGGDGCSASCRIETGWSCSTPGIPCAPICGDGITVGPEECDDGNQVDGDGCDSNCTRTGCGNGIVTAGEACDDGICLGGANNGKHCAANAGCPGGACERDPNFAKNNGPCVITNGGQCKNATCGDDDLCSDPRCTTGPKGKPEQCDFGSLNGVPYSGCKSNCSNDLRVPSCFKRLALWSVESSVPGGKPASQNVVCQDGAACDADHQVNGECEFSVDLCVLVQSKPGACNPQAIYSVEFLGPDMRQCWQAQAVNTLASEVSNLAPATIFGRCRNGASYGRECTVGNNGGCDTASRKGDGVCLPGVLFDNPLTLPPGNHKDLCTSDTNAKTIAVPAGRRLRLHSQVPGYTSMNNLGVSTDGITLVCRPAAAAPTSTVGPCVPTPTPTP